MDTLLSMPTWLIASWIFFILVAIWIIQRLLGQRKHTEIAATGAIIYAAIIVKMAAVDDDFSWLCLIYMLVCLGFIFDGSRQLPFKTQAAVFDRITNEPIPDKIVTSGKPFLGDPFFDNVTASINGEPNVTVDLQEVRIKIHATPQMQTKTRGIKALVRHIGLMLKIKAGNLSRAFEIEGGVETMKQRIEDYVFEIVLEKVSETEAQRLDQDKKGFIKELANFIKDEINHFCAKASNNYPYEVIEDVTIGDTELDEIYYQALAKRAITIMEQEAENEKAKMIRERLLETGRYLMPNGSEAEQLNAALISLGIKPATSEEKKYTLDLESLRQLRQFLTDVVLGKKK